MTNTRTQFVSTRVAGHSNGNKWGRNQNLTPFSSSVKLGPVTNIIILAVLLGVLGMIYLSQMTKIGSYSETLYAIDQKRLDLESERADLLAENARLQALSRVQNSAVAATMSDPASIDHTN